MGDKRKGRVERDEREIKKGYAIGLHVSSLRIREGRRSF
jgi:hypothetical protein